MAIISEVKCPRCDKRFSGLRLRCPYCGARRGSSGKHASENDNSKGKLIIGILLLVILIVAVVVLVVTSTKDADKDLDANPTGSDDVGPSDPEDGIVTVPGNNDDYTPPPTTDDGVIDDGPGVSAAIQSIVLQYNGRDIQREESSGKQDFMMSVGEDIQLTAKITPTPAEDEVVDVSWESSNESVFMVVKTGKVTAIGKGTATLTVTVGGVSTECIVRVN